MHGTNIKIKNINRYYWNDQTKVDKTNRVPISVAAGYKAWVCRRSLAGIAGSNRAAGMNFVSCECCVLSGRGLCVELITHPEGLYRVWCIQWVLAKPRKGRPWPRIGPKRHREEKKKYRPGTYGEEEKNIQYFGGEARREDLGVEGKMILKLKVQKLGPSRPCGPPSLLYNRYRSFPGGGVKRPERGADHPLPSSVEVKERVELTFTPSLCLCGLF
jgi:hypothetical protein